MLRAELGALWVAGALVACVDFGDPAPDASAVDAALDAAVVTPDASGVCVEGPVDPTTPGIEIRIAGFTLDKLSVTVPPGGVVVWRNDDSMRHQLVSGAPRAVVRPADGGFDTGELGRGDMYAHRFCEARSIVYFCATHPGSMKGYMLEIP